MALMAKDINDLKILDIISANQAGMTLEEVERYRLGIPRRTLQRRLQQLVASNFLEVSGHTRATRYRVMARGHLPAVPSPVTAISGKVATYVDLDRQFSEIAIPADQSPEDMDLSAWRIKASQSWDDILEIPCPVIIAEAGSGKTTEMRNQAARLRGQGKTAFFARLELLSTPPLKGCFEDGPDFDLWLSSNDKGYFFLDSVDEAVVASPGDFERAIISFAHGVGAKLANCTVVISTRPGAWRGDVDADMLRRRLGLGRPAAQAGTAGLPNADGGSDLVDEPIFTAESQAKSRLAIFQMEPLNQDQIEKFAYSQAPQAAGRFLSELVDEDALNFASRPDDLSGLIEIWSRNGSIGNYTDIIHANLQSKLITSAGARTGLSPDRAVKGAELLAAAVVFARRSSIRLTQTSVATAQRPHTLSPQEILRGWSTSEVEELLQRPLFDPSQYGCVRFHHRTFVEYLAARWLKRLLDEGAPRRRIEQLLFAYPYGDRIQVMIPSMKPIAAWLASWDQDIRDKIIRTEPRTLIEHGDAAQLDASVKTEILRKFAAQYRDRPHTPLRASSQDVRRLAAPGLGPLLREMLTEHRRHDDMRQLLLRVIREGGKHAGYDDCADAVMSFALDQEMDAYTRSCAVQACAAVCGEPMLARLVTSIVDGAEHHDRSVLAAVVEALYPTLLTIPILARLLEQAKDVDSFSTDNLCYQVESLAKNVSTQEERLELLAALDDLLSREPLVDQTYGRISQRYSWLLQPAFELAARSFVDMQGVIRREVLSVISKALQADHLHRYTGDVHKDASELVLTNTDLKHALFWFEVEQKRKTSTTPVQDYWFGSHELLMVNDEDFDFMIACLRDRKLGDDQIIAMKALVRLVSPGKRATAKVRAIKQAVSDRPDLLAALELELKRGKLSPEVRASMARMRAAESRNQARLKANEANRRSWIETLKSDPSRVGDVSLAATGTVWNNTIWLHDEIRRHRKENSSWTVSDWQFLIEDFGPVVAQNYRDLCQGYWRAYKAELRSEAGGDKNSTPWAVIIGLSGLAMEAQSKPHWAARLSQVEAEYAVRLALLELNSFPDWLWGLYRYHPEVVRQILAGEAKWELSLPPGKDTGYVLSRLRWTDKELATALRPDVFELLRCGDPVNARALSEALTLILRDPTPVPPSFVTLLSEQIDKEEEEDRKALWISALICVDATKGIRALTSWLRGTEEPIGERRMSLVLNNVWGDGQDNLQNQHRDFLAPAHLVTLIRLAHAHIRHADDIEHTGAYSPGQRDHAQHARSYLLKLLCERPGRRTYDGLVALASDFKGEYFGDRLLELADDRAGADAELEPWLPVDVAEFNDDAERMPANEVDLYNIARARLDDLKLELEEGDESESSLLRKVSDELELRRVIARRLRQAARGRYTTASEEELADVSRTDIRLHNPRVQHRIPIELKIAEKWSAAQLRERLENQLVDQYLREAKTGIFLLVRRGGVSGKSAWPRKGAPNGDFDQLVDWLNSEASQLRQKYADLRGLSVVSIDLTKRDRSHFPKNPQKKRVLRSGR
jgi:hypothetical protein